jgi:Peptidase propeptide and YPEB domain
MKYGQLVLALALGLAAAAAFAQAPTYKRHVPDALAKNAKITEEAAVAAARKRVPKGTIESLELEHEKGRLIYSFDMKVPGHSGAEEVNVDANTGEVIGVWRESAKTEEMEAAREAKEAKEAAGGAKEVASEEKEAAREAKKAAREAKEAAREANEAAREAKEAASEAKERTRTAPTKP